MVGLSFLAVSGQWVAAVGGAAAAGLVAVGVDCAGVLAAADHAGSTATGRRPYVAIWLSSVLFWIAVMQGIRSGPLGQLPRTRGAGSVSGDLCAAVHRGGSARGASLAHAAAAWPHRSRGRASNSCAATDRLASRWPCWRTRRRINCAIIQVADLVRRLRDQFRGDVGGGGRGDRLVGDPRDRWRVWPWLYALSLVVAGRGLRTVSTGPGDGHARGDRPAVRVALIQGSIDTIFEDNPDRSRQMLEQYTDLTRKHVPATGPWIWSSGPSRCFRSTSCWFEPGVELELDPSLDRGCTR